MKTSGLKLQSSPNRDKVLRTLKLYLSTVIEYIYFYNLTFQKFGIKVLKS